MGTKTEDNKELFRYRWSGEEFAKKYPHLSGQARLIHTSEDRMNNISFETYLRGELKTYSMETLVRYAAMVVEFAKKEINMVEEIMRQTTEYYDISGDGRRLNKNR